MLCVNVHPVRGRLLEKKRLAGGVYYSFITVKNRKFMKEGCSKESDYLKEKEWYITVT